MMGGPSPSLKVVFLDVDGVLLSARSLTYDFEDSDDTLFHDPAGVQVPIERCLLQNLQRLLQTTGARIVLSTTWRLEPDMRAFLMIALASVGIAASAVLGDTPDLKAAGRGAEVARWVEQHRPVEFAIVDDDDRHAASFAEHSLSARFVQTVMRDEGGDRSREGLTAEKAALVVAIIEGQAERLAERG